MNCTQARKVLHELMDGEEHHLAGLAHGHLGQCDDCRQWYSQVCQAVAHVSACDGMPVNDISSAVMARLPAKHPASATSSQRCILSSRFVLCLGAGWLVGALVIGLVFVVGRSLMSTGMGGHVIVDSYALCKAWASVLQSGRDTAVRILVSMVSAITATWPVLGTRLFGLVSVVTAFDIAVGCIAVFLRKKRRTFLGLFCA